MPSLIKCQARLKWICLVHVLDVKVTSDEFYGRKGMWDGSVSWEIWPVAEGEEVWQDNFIEGWVGVN